VEFLDFASSGCGRPGSPWDPCCEAGCIQKWINASAAGCLQKWINASVTKFIPIGASRAAPSLVLRRPPGRRRGPPLPSPRRLPVASGSSFDRPSRDSRATMPSPGTATTASSKIMAVVAAPPNVGDQRHIPSLPSYRAAPAPSIAVGGKQVRTGVPHMYRVKVGRAPPPGPCKMSERGGSPPPPAATTRRASRASPGNSRFHASVHLFDR
jgi:hypothetical protein